MSENTKLREALTTLGLAEYANELLGESTATLSNVPAVFERPISIGGSGSELARVTPDGTTTIHWPVVEQAAKEDHFLSAVAKLLIAARDVGRAPAPAQEAAAPQGWRFKRNADDSIGIFAPPPKPGESQRTSHAVYPGQNRDLHELLGKLADTQAATPTPAPAVPDGLQWFTVAEHGIPEIGAEVIGGLWYTDPWIKTEFATTFMWGQCRVVESKHRDFKDGKQWCTFGPSHNQITHWARINTPGQTSALAPAQEVGLTDDERQQVFRNAETRMVREINLSWRTAVVDEVIAALRAKEKT